MRPIEVIRRVPDFIVTDVKHFAKKFYKKPIIKLAQIYRQKLNHVEFVGITGVNNFADAAAFDKDIPLINPIANAAKTE